jgi:guanine deaminase
MSSVVLRGRLLTPADAGGVSFVDDARMEIRDGKIAAIDRWFDGAAHRVIDVRPSVIAPGFVDAHVHFPQTRVIGRAGAPLLEWLDRTIFPEEARFAGEAGEGYARAVAADFVGALASNGTTTAAVYSSSDERATGVLFEALAASGLRAIAGLTLMDRNAPEALLVRCKEAMAACDRLAARWHGHDGGRLGFAVTPRFALSCSRELLEEAARFADRGGLVVQTHVAEHPAEGRAVLAEHPIATDYLGVYEAVGLVGPRTLLAHAIHFSESEWDRLAARGVSIAHCPDSNFFLGSGRMNLAAARDRSVKVALGSDVAAGRSFDMRRAMACAYDSALCLGQRTTAEELFAMATAGGARALGLEAVTGSLSAGKDADFVTLSLPAPAATADEVLAQIVFAGGVRVERAYVRGREVFRSPSAA